LVYQLTTTFSELTATYEGRDKLTKLIQYSLRLLAWYKIEVDME
jgi:hypothetical protein